MKSEMFLSCLTKAIHSGNFSLDGKDGVEVILMDGNNLKCKKDKKEFEFCVEKILASKKGGGQFYELSSKAPKSATKKTSKKKTTNEDNEGVNHGS